MEKKINIYYINKIIDCNFKIFLEEDEDIPNRRVIAANERVIEH